MNLVLIDGRINDVPERMHELNENVDYLIFSYETDTYETIKQKIINLGNDDAPKKYECIGIYPFQYNSTYLDLFYTENIDISLETNNFIQFCKWIHSTYNPSYIDLLFYTASSTTPLNDTWNSFIENMQQFNINIRTTTVSNNTSQQIFSTYFYIANLVLSTDAILVPAIEQNKSINYTPINSSIVVKGLTNGVIYDIVIKVGNPLESNNSNTFSGIPFTAPSPPTITNAVSDTETKTIFVSFLPSEYNGGLPMLKYYYSIDRITYIEITNDIVNNTFTIYGLKAGVYYDITMKASSWFEGVLNGTAVSYQTDFSIDSQKYTAIIETFPDPPTIDGIEYISNGDVHVYFTLGSANGSPIYRLQYSINEWKTYTTVSNVQSPLIIKNFQVGTRYTFQIKSYNNFGLSYSSNLKVFMPMSSITKNTTMIAKKAMPPKDKSSDNSAEFSQYRRLYEQTMATFFNNDPTKKWTGEQPIASTLTYKKKIIAIGEGSINAEGEPFSFVNEKDTSPEEALRRLRRQRG